MTRVFKHAVAVLAKGSHVVGYIEISQPEYFWNVDGFWTGQALVTLGAAIAS